MDDASNTLNEEGRALWDQKAAFWDELHGDDGNEFHRMLISPAVESLLALKPGQRILDVACGSGQLARRLAALGGRVTACDFSPALIERARLRDQSQGEPIRYQVVDATDEAALAALGEKQFDAITCTMALMDMPSITPLFRAAARLLATHGRFVFATAHPAFNSNNPVFVAEMQDVDGDLRIDHALKISHYGDMTPVKAAGAIGEPAAHYYYHRPLHVLLGEAFAAGFVLDGLLEPTFPAAESDPRTLRFWHNVPDIPPVLAGRLRFL